MTNEELEKQCRERLELEAWNSYNDCKLSVIAHVEDYYTEGYTAGRKAGLEKIETLKATHLVESATIKYFSDREIESLKKELEEVRGYNISLASENRKLQEQCELLIESAECRGDEDCDHCEAVRVCKPCQVERDVIESLKKEFEQQMFNNKNNLSIDQKVSDEIDRLKAENNQLKLYREKHQEIYAKRYLEYKEEHQKLKNLVERAKPWISFQLKIDTFTEQNDHLRRYLEEKMQWLKETEEVLK